MITEKVLFSVLIANYNNGKYITRSVESVLAQTYNRWEIIIVDDGSVDDSINVITPFLKNARIHLYRNENNRGCGFTKNRCVQLAKGSICGFLDPDDALTSDALEIMVEEHRLQPAYSLINSTYYECDEGLNIRSISTDPRPIPGDRTYLVLSGSVSHFATFKMKFYEMTGGIDTALKKAVDQDLYYKLEDYGPIGYIDKPLYFYRHHAENISLGRNKIPALIVHMAVLEKAIKRRMRMRQFKMKRNGEIKISLLTELNRIRYLMARNNDKRLQSILYAGGYVCFGIVKKILQWSDTPLLRGTHKKPKSIFIY